MVVGVIQEEPVDESGARRTILWAEFVVVMACMFPLVFGHFVPSGEYADSLYSRIYDIVHPFGRIALILFIVWVADGNLKSIGIDKPRVKQDLIAALLVFAALIAIAIPVFMFRPPHLPKPSLDSTHILVPASVLGLGVISRRLLYEIAFRGYGIGRLTELMGNAIVPIIIFAVVSSSVDWHNGLIITFADIWIYSVAGAVFARTKRIWGAFVVLALFEAWGQIQIYQAMHWLS